MPLSTAVITYDLASITGDPHHQGASVTASTNIPGSTIADTDGNQIRLGAGKGSVSTNGTGQIDVWIPGTGSNPASWQTYITVKFRDKLLGSETRTFGPFTITASGDLADLIAEQEVPPEYLTMVTDLLDTYVDSSSAASLAAAASATSAAASAALAEDISGIATPDALVETLVENPASLTALALSATYVPRISEHAVEGTAKTLWRVDPLTPGHAPFEARFNSFSNHFTAGGIDAQTVPDAGDYNHAVHMGYNPGRHNGGPVIADVPGWFLGLEDRWPDPEGDGTTGPEFYLEYVSPDGTSVPTSLLRPLYVRLLNGWDNNPANKSVQAFFDIGQGPDGNFSVWGGIQNGRQIMTVDQDTFATYVDTLAHLGNVIQCSPIAGQATVLIKAPGGATTADKTADLKFQIGADLKWSFVADEYNELILIDQYQGRYHAIFNTGTSSATASTTLKSKAVVEGVLAVGSASGTPTATATANLGTAPPAPVITGNAARGKVTFGTGTVTVNAGGMVTVDLPDGAYASAPTVVVSPGNYLTATRQPYVIQPGDGGLPADQFQIALASGPSALSQAVDTYQFTYMVMG